jgi:hypothetical protein
LLHFTVRIRGKGLNVIDLGPPLEAAGIRLTVAQHGEPVEWLLAHLDAGDAEAAQIQVREAMEDALPDGDYTVDLPVQTD